MAPSPRFRCCVVYLVAAFISARGASNYDDGQNAVDGTISVRSASGLSGFINVCFECDTTCQAIGNVDHFFQNVVNKANQLLSSGFGVGVNLGRIEKARRRFDLIGLSRAAYANTDRPSLKQLMAAANQKHWVAGRFESWKSSYACDTAFAVTRSHFFKNLAGFASFGAMCTSRAVGWLKMTTDTNRMGSTLAHELAHSMGVSHDQEAVDPAYRQYPAHTTSAIFANCVGGSVCPDRSCIMSGSLDSGGGVLATKVTACSKAYFNFWASGTERRWPTDCIDYETAGDEGSG